jgi:hypothetical protein
MQFSSQPISFRRKEVSEVSDETISTVQKIIPSRRRWWRDVAMGIAIFACGFLVGGVVLTKVYTHRLASIQQNGIDKQRAFARFKRALDLNEDQAKQVQSILSKGFSDLRDIRRSVRPQVDTTLQRVRAEVAAVLDERQKKKWETRFDLMRERWFPASLDAASNDGGFSK